MNPRIQVNAKGAAVMRPGALILPEKKLLWKK